MDSVDAFFQLELSPAKMSPGDRSETLAIGVRDAARNVLDLEEGDRKLIEGLEMAFDRRIVIYQDACSHAGDMTPAWENLRLNFFIWLCSKYPDYELLFGDKIEQVEALKEELGKKHPEGIQKSIDYIIHTHPEDIFLCCAEALSILGRDKKNKGRLVDVFRYVFQQSVKHFRHSLRFEKKLDVSLLEVEELIEMFEQKLPDYLRNRDILFNPLTEARKLKRIIERRKEKGSVMYGPRRLARCCG